MLSEIIHEQVDAWVFGRCALPVSANTYGSYPGRLDELSKRRWRLEKLLRSPTDLGPEGPASGAAEMEG